MTTFNRFRFWVLLFVFFVIYLIAQFGVGLYTDLLWFQHLNLESVFLTKLWARFVVGLAVAIPFAILFWVNAFIARWLSIRNVLFFSEETLVAQKFIGWAILAAGLFLAWLVGTTASTNWLLFLRFLNQHSFNLTDPIFEMDVSFYIFSLPLYHFIQTWLIVVLFLSGIGAIGVYAIAQRNNLSEGKVVVLPHVQLHLSVLGALIFLSFAWGHWLDLFDLMYSPRGVAFGASYTDVHVSIPALWTMVAVAVAAAIMLIVNVFLRRPALSLLAIFIWIVVGIVGTGFIPGLVQRYIVEPSELTREAPYIENNIKFTRQAYNLDKIAERDFAEIESLTQAALAEDETIRENLRLWDYRPLQQTYEQIQAIRLYYQFPDIDFDRYMIDGELRQVALAGRELDKSQLQSPTWVNRKLQFTHGFGAVVNPVSEVTNDGLPVLWVKDLPPQSKFDELAINRPEIYYGENTDDYVYVNTGEREFDYPSGDQNVYTSYQGSGGVVMDSYLKRLGFALRLSDVNLLLGQAITYESRVLLHRSIDTRVQRIAPFLRYDNDPYLVIGPEGKLFWIQDAYTTSDLFPYSEPFNSLNYIRNSVKVVMDAYNGSLTFYVVDEEDPLLQAYADIFPRLFTPMGEMPDWLIQHIRYPEGMFRIQAELYRTYHMRDINVFYNKEDLWQVPMENFAGNTQPVEPYYVVIKLPGEDTGEFALIQPFTPNNKDNLIGWLAARSDAPHYGELVVYRFPKQELIFGPLQIEGRIDQNPNISSQITLWDQGGSEVIRGNLLVLPVENSLLYVEPLYLRAENGEIPELKRIILASGERIVMRETLEQAMAALFEGAPTVATIEAPAGTEAPLPADVEVEQPQPAAADEPATDDVTVPTSGNVGELIQTASGHYDAAQAALQRGDWATYGTELDRLEVVLDRLIQLTNETSPEQ